MKITSARPASGTVREWSGMLDGALKAHASGRTVIRASSMMRPDVVESDRARVIAPRAGERGALRFLENTVVGSDWAAVEPPVDQAEIPRVALYGVKGGVGRSTAAALLARHLAEQGETVLVVDLDLESPGVSSLLVSSRARFVRPRLL
jgi:Mrp family chromosome partitioning ATPase